nr:hypothetical protein [Oceanibium sediminis]
MLTAAKVAQTQQQAGAIAAGFLEDLLNLHGPAVIARIEDTAARSARMRYLLSGVWASDIDQPTWARVLAARAPGPDMEKGAPQPPADG